MTGRGIDQILPHPGDPRLQEPYVTSALRYVELAEAANGTIRRPADYAYIWGDALAAFDRAQPAARIVNLETSITTSSERWPKDIHYRMHPENVACLAAAGIDCCALANNHLMDCGYTGLAETLETLERAGIAACGAGLDQPQAEAPAIIEAPGQGRVLVYSCATTTSGVPPEWGAGPDAPGVNLLADLSDAAAARIADRVRSEKKPGDIAVVSIHWGGNWGYRIPADQVRFAHRLTETGGVDVVHGHSSHHAKGVEIHQGKLILYGCGDFLNDYEGIGGYEGYRGDLSLMYLPTVETESGRLKRLELVPFQVRQFRLKRARHGDAHWLRDTLNREGRRFGTQFTLTDDRTLTLTRFAAQAASRVRERGEDQDDATVT